jgi:hypothetical protein
MLQKFILGRKVYLLGNGIHRWLRFVLVSRGKRKFDRKRSRQNILQDSTGT